MSDLKTLYDRVITAQANIETVKNQIADALALGTPEGEDQALALESALDQAVADEAKWRAFYNKLVNASQGSEALKKFIPLTSTEVPADDEAQEPDKRVMTFNDFQKLTPVAQMTFVKSGGTLEG